MDYKNFILLTKRTFKDKIKKRMSLVYLDNDNTIIHLIQNAKLNNPVDIHNLFIQDSTGYTIDQLTFSISDSDKIFDKVFPELQKALIIKYPGYIDYYKELWENKIIPGAVQLVDDGNTYYYMYKFI